MKTARPAQISIVIPFYNEAENLALLTEEIEQAMSGSSPGSWELIYIDDGSTDDGLAVLRDLAADREPLRILQMRRNSGQSAALGAGFAAARGDWTITLDADLQNDPADISKLLAAREEGDWDVVSGVRAQRRDNLVRKISSRLANGVRSRILHDGTSDVGCSLRVCRTEMLRRVPVFNGMHRFLPALLILQGARMIEIPVNHRPRVHGVSKYGVGNRLWRGILDLFGVRWWQMRAVDPHAVDEITPS